MISTKINHGPQARDYFASFLICASSSSNDKTFSDHAMIGVGQNQPRQRWNGRGPFRFFGFLRHAPERE